MSSIAYPPRVKLAFLPTPLQPLPRLSAYLTEAVLPCSAAMTGLRSINLWIKRDDQTGLAGGGNKTRKLEYLLADALESGADTLITTGAAQSNHCRQTAAAAAQAGLGCHLILGGQPSDRDNGNLLLDRLMGAELHWTDRADRVQRLSELADELRVAGRRPYVVPYGGSNPVGAAGYVLAIEELEAQCRTVDLKPDLIVFASSSGGTQAGLLTGAWALGWDTYRSPLLGISVDEPKATLQAKVADLATKTAGHLGMHHDFAPGEVEVESGYVGKGYGVLGDLERDAIRTLARSEGILLDPVYTGRAFGGFLDLLSSQPERLRGTAQRGMLTVVFWHTGGTPALFAYAEELAV